MVKPIFKSLSAQLAHPTFITSAVILNKLCEVFFHFTVLKVIEASISFSDSDDLNVSLFEADTLSKCAVGFASKVSLMVVRDT